VSSDFVLANGDVTMASFHADYIAGFDEKVLRGLMERSGDANCVSETWRTSPETAVTHQNDAEKKVDDIQQLLIGSFFVSQSSAEVEQVYGGGRNL
jgi:hypothetical protein